MTSGKKVAVGCGIAVPLICCLGGWLVVQSTFGRAAGRRDAALAKARSLGIPLDSQDLVRMTTFRDSESANETYLKIFKLVGQGRPLEKDLNLLSRGIGKNLKPKDKQAAVEAFAKLGGVLALTHQAATYPHANFKRDWSDTIAMKFPELSMIRGLVRLLCYEAERKNDAGDWRGALASLQDAQRVGRHAGEDPIMIGLLVQIACESIVHRSFRNLMADHPDNAAFVSEAQKVLAGFGPMPDYRRSLGGEVVMGRQAVDHLENIREMTGQSDANGGPVKSNPLERAVFRTPVIRSAFDARVVEAYTDLIGNLPKDPEDWETAANVARRFGARIEKDHSPENMLNQIIFPVFSGAAEAIGNLQMNRRLDDTTLRLLALGIKNKSYPDRLPDFGKSRIDPFSGSPFVYRKEGNGFILYSVGRDRIDDGGKTAAETKSSNHSDEVMRVVK